MMWGFLEMADNSYLMVIFFLLYKWSVGIVICLTSHYGVITLILDCSYGDCVSINRDMLFFLDW